jgi:hypothetical protein
MIGRLMYAMTATRPNITYAFGVFSLYSHDPSYEHMVALKQVFRYLYGTNDLHPDFGGALAGALGGAGEGTLGSYVDSDYAGRPDD